MPSLILLKLNKGSRSYIDSLDYLTSAKASYLIILPKKFINIYKYLLKLFF